MNESQRAKRRAFYDWTRFPELAEARTNYRRIHEEAKVVLAELGSLFRERIGENYVLPLLGGPEDRHPVADPIFARARALSPYTSQLLTPLPYVVAFGFSFLFVGGSIPSHEHWNPHLVAALCLQGGAGSHIIVNGERQNFADGEFVVFDYTHAHESHNQGSEDRYVLLITINPRRAPRPPAPKS